MSEDDYLTELSKRAQKEYDEDPMGSSIKHLEDLRYDVTPEVEEGLSFGIYILKKDYITHSENYECECECPDVVEFSDGHWECETCGVTLVESTESVV